MTRVITNEMQDDFAETIKPMTTYEAVKFIIKSFPNIKRFAIRKVLEWHGKV